MSLRTRRHAAEDIAATDHQGQLHAQRGNLGHIRHHAFYRCPVDAVGIVAHQGFTGKFEEDALVGWLGHGWLLRELPAIVTADA